MSNQTILWASVILPWVSVFFLKKEDLKRYMPVALLGSLITTFLTEVGISLGWWVVYENIFPLINIPVISYSGYLVGIIWIFKFTYRNFLKYLATNLIIDSVLSVFILRWFSRRGILDIHISDLQILLLSTIIAFFLYAYQLWQESDMAIKCAPDLQPAASKHLDEKDKTGNPS
ncbi:hypothetical protein HSX37_04225|uniref:Uncharacterized protein n=1 Tax=Dendrosporobacter quercicolus TaxID=146817 RepID=A0A1G9N8B8_9FIRM|nr:hypothetical protein [Dendrosporobacter quercicolus]NSL47261.1 hypothetical protein [Dendrosporobacter quercicolus DSM 1736]SDL82708.1 hypothetical protein SAMN04488502_101927 [Dendrosporobacter quercicolus]